MSDYTPETFMPKYNGKYHVHFFVPLPEVNQTLVLHQGPTANGAIKKITYNVVVDNNQQIADGFHIINEHPDQVGHKDEDSDGCHSVEIVVIHPTDGSEKKTIRRYDTHDKK